MSLDSFHNIPIQSIEPVLDAIRDYVLANQTTVLNAIQQEHSPSTITIEDIKYENCYIAPNYIAYTQPSLFVMAGPGDFSTEENFITSTHDIVVGVVVEEENTDRLTRKVLRYLSMLERILHDTSMTIDTVMHKKICHLLVTHQDPTGDITTPQKDDASLRTFRKEGYIIVRAIIQEG